MSQIRIIPPPFGGCSLQFPSTSEDVVSQRENMQDAQDDRNVRVINRNQCNQCNQSIPASTQVSDHLEQSSPNLTDYSDGSDYVDYIDYTHESVATYWSHTQKPDLPSVGAPIQYLSEAGDLLTEGEDHHDAQDHQVDYADGVINRNQRNQSDLTCSQSTLQVEKSESTTALHTKGMEAWSSYVISQGSFAVLNATQYAIKFCKKLGIGVPDLSGEVKRLVKAGE